MKKVIALLLALTMVFALAACGDKPSGGGSTTPPSASSGTQSNTPAENDAGSSETADPAPSGEPKSFTTVRPGTSGEQSIRVTHYFEGAYQYSETVCEYLNEADAQVGYQYYESLGGYDDLKTEGSKVSYKEEGYSFAGMDYDTALAEQKSWMKAQPEAYEDVELVENQ